MPFYMRFVMGRVGLGLVLLRVLMFFPVSINPPVPHYHRFIYYQRYVML